MDHPVAEAREILVEKRVEIICLRAGAARKEVVVSQHLEVGEIALNATNCILCKVRESFVEPRRLEVLDRRILKAIPGVDHVLELVGDRAPGSLPHRAGRANVSEPSSRIGGKKSPAKKKPPTKLPLPGGVSLLICPEKRRMMCPFPSMSVGLL